LRATAKQQAIYDLLKKECGDDFPSDLFKDKCMQEISIVKLRLEAEQSHTKRLRERITEFFGFHQALYQMLKNHRYTSFREGGPTLDKDRYNVIKDLFGASNPEDLKRKMNIYVLAHERPATVTKTAQKATPRAKTSRSTYVPTPQLNVPKLLFGSTRLPGSAEKRLNESANRAVKTYEGSPGSPQRYGASASHLTRRASMSQSPGRSESPTSAPRHSKVLNPVQCRVYLEDVLHEITEIFLPKNQTEFQNKIQDIFRKKGLKGHQYESGGSAITLHERLHYVKNMFAIYMIEKIILDMSKQDEIGELRVTSIVNIVNYILNEKKKNPIQEAARQGADQKFFEKISTESYYLNAYKDTIVGWRDNLTQKIQETKYLFLESFKGVKTVVGRQGGSEKTLNQLRLDLEACESEKRGNAFYVESASKLCEALNVKAQKIQGDTGRALYMHYASISKQSSNIGRIAGIDAKWISVMPDSNMLAIGAHQTSATMAGTGQFTTHGVVYLHEQNIDIHPLFIALFARFVRTQRHFTVAPSSALGVRLSHEILPPQGGSKSEESLEEESVSSDEGIDKIDANVFEEMDDLLSQSPQSSRGSTSSDDRELYSRVANYPSPSYLYRATDSIEEGSKESGSTSAGSHRFFESLYNDSKDLEEEFVQVSGIGINAMGRGNGGSGHNHRGLCFDQEHALKLVEILLSGAGKGSSVDSEDIQEALKQAHEKELKDQAEKLQAEVKASLDLLESRLDAKMAERDKSHKDLIAAQGDARAAKEEDLKNQMEALKAAMKEAGEHSGKAAEAAKLAHESEMKVLAGRLDDLHKSSEIRIVEIHSSNKEEV